MLFSNILFEELKIDDHTILNGVQLNLKNLTLFAGKNGVSKSLIHKFIWFAGLAGPTYSVLSMQHHPSMDELFLKELQKNFELTFHDPEQLSVGALFEGDVYNFRITVTKGIVESFAIDVKQPQNFTPQELGIPRYNTKECRTFDQYERYLKLKNKMGITTLSSDSKIRELCEFYKLYEVMWFEGVQAAFKEFSEGNTLELTTRLNKAIEIFKETQSDEWKGMVVKEGKPYILKNNSEIRFAVLSSGEQSLLMLTLFT